MRDFDALRDHQWMFIIDEAAAIPDEMWKTKVVGTWARNAGKTNLVDKCFRDAELRIMADMARKREEKTRQDIVALLSEQNELLVDMAWQTENTKTSWPTDAWRRLYTSTHQPKKETKTMGNTTIQAINKLEGPILDSIHAYGEAKHEHGAAQTKAKFFEGTTAKVDTWKTAGMADGTRNAALVLIADAIDKAHGSAASLPEVSGKFYVRGTYHGPNTELGVPPSYIGRGSADGSINSWWSKEVSAHLIQHTFAEAVKIAEEARRHAAYCNCPVTIESVSGDIKLAARVKQLEAQLDTMTRTNEGQARSIRTLEGQARSIRTLEAALAAARGDIGAKQRRIDSQAAAIRSLEAKVKEATTVLTVGVESTDKRIGFPLSSSFNIEDFAYNPAPRYFVLVDWEGRKGVVVFRDGTTDGLCSASQPEKLNSGDSNLYALDWNEACKLLQDAGTKARYSNARIIRAW